MADQNKKCSIIKYAVNIYHSLPGEPCSACETIGDFGHLVAAVYQLLPVSRMRISPRSGGFGMVAGCITNLYHGSDLGGIRPCIAFTSPWSPLGGITHSGLDRVLCWVIMDYDVWAMTGTCMT